MNSAAVIYLRVSTLEQAEEGVSLDAQRAKAEAWAKANGYEVAAVFRDAISGAKTTNRPGLCSALELACELRGALIVYSLSRLARSTKDALSISDRLSKAGADLVSLSEKIDTTSAAGKMVFRMLAVLAEFERDLISERTTAALAYKKAKGERVGQVPFGFDLAADGVMLSRNTSEQETLADLRTMRGFGWTWQRIADELNRLGICTKTGARWSLHNARKIALATAA